MSTMMMLLIVLIVLAAGGGMWGQSRWGWYGYSPVGLLVVVLLIVLFVREV